MKEDGFVLFGVFFGVTLDQSDEVWAIRSLTAKDDDGKPLYWSNEWGWGSGDSCQLFTAREHVECNLPIGGEWEKW